MHIQLFKKLKMEKVSPNDITSSNIREYCESHTSKPSNQLNMLYEDSKKTLKLKMLSGPFLGRFLSMISKIYQPETVLEIGTFTGYGSLCLAEGLLESGTLITIEKNPELEKISRPYFSGHNKKIITKIGDAAKIIPNLNYTFDLVFIDAAKRQYIKYYELILPKMRAGGIILADNVLWKGLVVNKNIDKMGQGLVEFNKHVNNDKRVENIIIPIDDGIHMIRKLA